MLFLKHFIVLIVSDMTIVILKINIKSLKILNEIYILISKNEEVISPCFFKKEK